MYNKLSNVIKKSFSANSLVPGNVYQLINSNDLM